MSVAGDTYVLLRAFVDELARCGMRAACTSPGSRCAPLVLSLARERRISCYSHVDERCAGFFALGLAKASGAPVAVTCTSGTAAAELLAAAIEAREARVPLLLLTADRPAELRENGAGQAIDQLKLFGDAAKWFVEVETSAADAAALRWIRTLACRAFWTASEGRPGAVHLNFPLREPLVSDEPLPADDSGRPSGAPYVGRLASGTATRKLPGASGAGDRALERLVELARGARRGVVVAGRHERRSDLGAAAARFCEAAGWPLLADPLSGARRGPAAVAHYDALLRDQRFAREHEPDVVIRVGDLPVSKPLRAWLASAGAARQIALDAEGAWQDPASVLSDSLALEPAGALAALAGALADPAESPVAATESAQARERDWLGSWRSADERAAEAILGVLAGQPLSEPALAAELGTLLPQSATLFVASSMPVREIETFWGVREDPPRVLCNRGANGIDGTVSSAFGAAAANAGAGDDSAGDGGAREDGASDGGGNDRGGSDISSSSSSSGGGGPTVLLIGDVALAHDIGGLLAAGRLGLKLTIVLVDNEGGGIFDFLTVSRSGDQRDQEIYSDHIATPTGLEFERAAALYGLEYEHAASITALREALERALEPRRERSTIVHVRGQRATNVALHARIWEAVAQALSPRAAAAGPGA